MPHPVYQLQMIEKPVKMKLRCRSIMPFVVRSGSVHNNVLSDEYYYIRHLHGDT